MTRKEDLGQEIRPEKIIIHGKYSIPLYLNDIALVKLKQPVKFTPFVRPVCLPEKDEQDLIIPGERGIAAGWGGTKHVEAGKKAKIGDLSDVLKHSSFQIQTDQLCSNKASLPINSTVTFCAGDGMGKSDTCSGDSGGAFVREAQRGDGKRRAWVAAGVVSWGDGCALKGHYGYYTRVYPFIEWIKQSMDAHINIRGNKDLVKVIDRRVNTSVGELYSLYY